MDFTYYVYIMASAKCGYLYIGITDNLPRRVHEHKTKTNPACHTAKHNITQLVFFESFNNVMVAIKREKQLKKWRRNWKFNLVETSNPTWQDLSLRFKAA
ncbi:MAG: GIY-YIG nuclease family protein [Proteobacteria bacterium]|nr:GIY-YIG nuclease family protein [Pseudomonadota bacterium]